MFKRIYSNGCSFMWGHHHNNPWYFEFFDETNKIDISKFKDECKKHSIQNENNEYTNPNVFKPFNDFDWVRKKYNYANVIAENYKVDLINESIFGGSLDRVIRKTINYIINSDKNELKETLFLIEIPPVGRGELYFCEQNRYGNFTSGEDNFDFLTEQSFKQTRKFFENNFDLENESKKDLKNLFILLSLFDLYNSKCIFIQTDNRLHAVTKSNEKYLSYEKCVEIQTKVNSNSVKFYISKNNEKYHPVENYYCYDLVHWIREEKITFKNHTNNLSLDGHNSILGSKKIAEQIINHINL
jgi:hypothetical protein